MALLRYCLPALAVFAGLAVAAPPARIEIDSLDKVDGRAIRLPAFWFPAETTGNAPAILLLHGCGGPYGRNGELSARMRKYSALLNAEGYHVLITDSLSPRGERELCTQKTAARKVTQSNRRRDALGALQWLAEHPGVDARKLVVLGWSNGGSNVLAATNASNPEVAEASVKPALAVAFYPGCRSELKRGYRPVAPLLMLLGGADDWTPPRPCLTMAETSAAPRPEVEVYPGAYHGFNSDSPLRRRDDVPNGVNPGQGVHVGGNADARAKSRERLLEFLHRLNAGAIP